MQERIKLNMKEKREGRGEHSRAVLVAPVEDEEWIGLAKEILFVQLVPAELHHHWLLMSRHRKRQRANRIKKFSWCGIRLSAGLRGPSIHLSIKSARHLETSPFGGEFHFKMFGYTLISSLLRLLLMEKLVFLFLLQRLSLRVTECWRKKSPFSSRTWFKNYFLFFCWLRRTLFLLCYGALKMIKCILRPRK